MATRAAFGRCFPSIVPPSFLLRAFGFRLVYSGTIGKERREWEGDKNTKVLAYGGEGRRDGEGRWGGGGRSAAARGGSLSSGLFRPQSCLPTDCALLWNKRPTIQSPNTKTSAHRGDRATAAVGKEFVGQWKRCQTEERLAIQMQPAHRERHRQERRAGRMNWLRPRLSQMQRLSIRTHGDHSARLPCARPLSRTRRLVSRHKEYYHTRIEPVVT